MIELRLNTILTGVGLKRVIDSTNAHSAQKRNHQSGFVLLPIAVLLSLIGLSSLQQFAQQALFSKMVNNHIAAWSLNYLADKCAEDVYQLVQDSSVAQLSQMISGHGGYAYFNHVDQFKKKHLTQSGLYNIYDTQQWSSSNSYHYSSEEASKYGVCRYIVEYIGSNPVLNFRITVLAQDLMRVGSSIKQSFVRR